MDVDVKFETVFDTIGELQTEGQQLDERLADVISFIYLNCNLFICEIQFR